MGAPREPISQAELDALNASSRAEAERWRREELPKVRAKMLRDGLVTRESVLDGIFSVDELAADGWVCDPMRRIWTKEIK